MISSWYLNCVIPQKHSNALECGILKQISKKEEENIHIVSQCIHTRKDKHCIQLRTICIRHASLCGCAPTKLKERCPTDVDFNDFEFY